MSLLRAQLRGLIAEQMRRLNVAGGNVVENRALPATTAQLPVVILTTPMERKESRGPGAPQFNTTVGIVAEIRTTGTTDDALDRLEALMEQVELAVLSNAAVMTFVQEAAAVETTSTLDDTNGTPIGSGRIAFHLVLPQVYNPALLQPLDQVKVDVGSDGFVPVEPIQIAVPPTLGS